MLRAVSFVVLALLAGSPSATDAKCATTGLAASVLTKRDAVVPGDGGIVVGYIDLETDKADPGDVAMQTGWRYRTHGAPKIESLAPGLAVYRVPVDHGTLELEDARHTVVGKVAVGKDKGPQLAAPKVKRVVHSSELGRRPWTKILVELDGPVPAGALAIVLADASGKPRSWGRVESGKPNVLAFTIRRCRILPNGTVESKIGDRVTLAWVDEAGRKSPATRPVVVTGTPPSAGD